MIAEERKPSLVNQFFGLLEDHLELVGLEYRYESDHLRRVLGFGMAAGVFALSAFVFLQIALVQALLAVGLSLSAAVLLLGGLYAAVSLGIYYRYCKRDPRTGVPFQTSLNELDRSIRWIHQHFS
jgi:uncharacterized membrane protein YqjE